MKSVKLKLFFMSTEQFIMKVVLYQFMRAPSGD